jgi:hypothetical protein
VREGVDRLRRKALVTPHRSDLLDPRPGYCVTQNVAWRKVEQAAIAERTIANVKR